MKNLLTFFCLILISFYSYSEEVSENQLVERQGITYKVNSTTPFNGTSVDNSGWLVYIRNYKNGKLDGPHEKYRGGQLEWRGNYKNGKKHGIYEEYDNDRLRLRLRQNYKNGELDGLSERFEINGDFSYRTNYKNGVRDGLNEDYGKNSIYFKENYKDGERDGLYDEFHCQYHGFVKGNWS